MTSRILPTFVEAYAEPPAELPALEECVFYHTVELPGIGVCKGLWDLRATLHEYLGSYDFSGKRVLEIGTANGAVCFELERRGAEVVALDLAEPFTYDAPPLSEELLAIETHQRGILRIRNAYWLAHRLLGSRARVVYAHANAIPAFLGRFDVVVLANVLQHLRDPVGALMHAAQITDAMVVTEADWFAGMYEDLQGMIYFGGDHVYSWYQVKPALVKAVLARMGFGDFVVGHHSHLQLTDTEYGPGSIKLRDLGKNIPHFTVTGTRMPVK